MRGAAVRVRRLVGRGFSAVNHLEEGAEEKRPVLKNSAQRRCVKTCGQNNRQQDVKIVFVFLKTKSP